MFGRRRKEEYFRGHGKERKGKEGGREERRDSRREERREESKRRKGGRKRRERGKSRDHRHPVTSWMEIEKKAGKGRTRLGEIRLFQLKSEIEMREVTFVPHWCVVIPLTCK